MTHNQHINALLREHKLLQSYDYMMTTIKGVNHLVVLREESWTKDKRSIAEALGIFVISWDEYLEKSS